MRGCGRQMSWGRGSTQVQMTIHGYRHPSAPQTAQPPFVPYSLMGAEAQLCFQNIPCPRGFVAMGRN